MLGLLCIAGKVYIVGKADFYSGVRDGLDPACRWSGKAIGSTGVARPSSQGSMFSRGSKSELSQERESSGAEVRSCSRPF
eukprot:5110138-Amphidinium_carterae.2